MKKVIKFLVLGALVLACQMVSAQDKLRKGNVLLNAGLGLGGYFYAGGLPVVFSAEFAINDAISIGPYFGFTSHNYNAFTYRYSYSFIDFGVRGSYHFSKHIRMSTDKLDLYGSLMLGYVVSSYSGTNAFGFSDPYPSAVKVGMVGGARWYFTKVFGVNGEVGYGTTPLLLGITFKL